MRKRYKIFLLIIVFLLVITCGLTIYMKFFRKSEVNDTKKTNIVHNIKQYGYSLDDRDSKLMKEEFYNLEDILDSEEVDYNKYVESISKLFIIDLFTMNNKVNKYDVGGLEYILDSEQEKFKNIVIDSIYSTLLDNSNNDRTQKLPIVSKVNINNITESTFMLGEESVNSYVVDIVWDYTEDLGYDNNAVLTIIIKDDKAYIVEYKVLEESLEESITE